MNRNIPFPIKKFQKIFWGHILLLSHVLWKVVTLLITHNINSYIHAMFVLLRILLRRPFGVIQKVSTKHVRLTVVCWKCSHKQQHPPASRIAS